MTCLCGRIAVFAPGRLQRRYSLRSDALVYDLQYRLRCGHCARRRGFTIVIRDRRDVPMGLGEVVPSPPILIVAREPGAR